MGKPGPADDHRPKNFCFGRFFFFTFSMFSFAVGDTVFLREPETHRFVIPAEDRFVIPAEAVCMRRWT